MFATLSEAFLVAGPNSTADSGDSLITINKTHHLEVTVTPWASLPNSTSTADFVVSEWHDTSNSFGLSLGPEGVTVFRSLGGPAMDMLLICSLLVLAAVLVATGFSSAGIHLTLLLRSSMYSGCFTLRSICWLCFLCHGKPALLRPLKCLKPQVP